MRIPAWFLLAPTLGLAGCADSVGPRSSQAVYALVRVGTKGLPVSDYPAPFAPTLLADTLLIPAEVAAPEGGPLTEIRVTLDANGLPSRGTQRFMATRRSDALLVDNCPLGALCIADLVYSTTGFLFVGDSLFEQVPLSSQLPPRVYARVQGRR